MRRRSGEPRRAAEAAYPCNNQGRNTDRGWTVFQIVVDVPSSRRIEHVRFRSVIDGPCRRRPLHQASVGQEQSRAAGTRCSPAALLELGSGSQCRGKARCCFITGSMTACFSLWLWAEQKRSIGPGRPGRETAGWLAGRRRRTQPPARTTLQSSSSRYSFKIRLSPSFFFHVTHFFSLRMQIRTVLLTVAD